MNIEQQLAAAQAENLRLREALENAKIAMQDIGAARCHYDIVIQALATPPGDMAALREVCARVIVEAKDNYVNVRNAADDLRSGEWTPEALK